MTEKPTAKSAEPESPPHSPEGNPPPTTTSTRSRRKKVVVSAVLAVLGAAVIALGMWMYPRRPEVTAPTSDILQIGGNSSYVVSHMRVINYYIVQVHPDVARLTVNVQLVGVSRVPRHAQAVIQIIHLPHGLPTLSCSPSPGCQGTTARVPVSAAGFTGASFTVRARSYEVASNGATTAVSFPNVTWYGTQQATMYMIYEYGIPAPPSYDWSSYQPQFVDRSEVMWAEPVVHGFGLAGTNGRVVTGVNHAAQQRDSNFTLIAGVLLGIGGSALVAAAQEALHD